MDNNCARHSLLIKQVHVAVWLLLLTAGGLLCSRVGTESSPVGAQASLQSTVAQAELAARVESPETRPTEKRKVTPPVRNQQRVAEKVERPVRRAANQPETVVQVVQTKNAGNGHSTTVPAEDDVLEELDRLAEDDVLADDDVLAEDDVQVEDDLQEEVVVLDLEDEAAATAAQDSLDVGETLAGSAGSLSELVRVRELDGLNAESLDEELALDEALAPDEELTQIAETPERVAPKLTKRGTSSETIAAGLVRDRDGADGPLLADKKTPSVEAKTVVPQRESIQSSKTPKVIPQPATTTPVKPAQAESKIAVRKTLDVPIVETSDPRPKPPNTPIVASHVLKIRNPKKIGYPVAFLYGQEQWTLQPGQVFERDLSKPNSLKLIQYDRGGDFGEGRLNPKPGDFDFSVTRKGWTIVPSKTANTIKK